MPDSTVGQSETSADFNQEAHAALVDAWNEIDQAWGRVNTDPTEARDRLDRATKNIRAALDALDWPYVPTPPEPLVGADDEHTPRGRA